MNSYIFILCPPYSGSTVLWKLVSTSSTVSALPCEGQFLTGVEEVMRKDPWNSDIKLPWKNIKKIWDDHWNQDKLFFVEKSPPNLIHTDEIVKHFSPVYFLLMVRNPYAHCEGLIRRNKWDARRAAEFTVRCLRQQAQNADTLNTTLCLTYEELVENPETISQRIQSFIPQIGELKYDQRVKVHSIDGSIERGIVDLNKTKIQNLSINNLRQINNVLKSNSDVMDFWGYEYYRPSLLHALNFLKKRSSLLASKTLSKVADLLPKLPKL